MARRNPMSVDKLKGALRQWSGTLSGEARVDAEALIALVESDADFAEQFTAAVNAKLEKREAKRAEAEAAKAAAEAAAQAEAEAAKAGASVERGAVIDVPPSGELTDRQAWTTLAHLVDASADVRSLLTDEERAAIKAAFLEEAARAA